MKLPFIFLITVWCSLFPLVAKEAKAPNIIVLLADDAGYADFGYTGSGLIKTPGIDSIAHNGVKFTAAYVSASVCSPSRAGLLTGRYQQRFGHEYNLGNVIGDDKSMMGMAVEEKTMADYLRELGYRTSCFGKWHLGYEDKFHPNKRGFDYFYGFRAGHHGYFNTKGVEEQMKPVPYRDDIYMTDLLTDKACEWMRKEDDRPFFVYLAYNAPHTPLHAKKEDLETYSFIKDKKKQATLAMTACLDRQSSKVLQTLKELNKYDNTLLVFLNDNGGQCQTNHANNAPYNGMKGCFLDGGVRVPFAMQWPARLKAGSVYHKPVSSLDLLTTFIAAANGEQKVEIPPKKALDGVDLLPYVNGIKKGEPHKTLYWRRAKAAAVRDGDWKLIRLPDRMPMLFNLKDDVSEQNNLQASQPQKTAELLKKLFQWETTLSHPRWRTGYMWIKNNTSLYDLNYKLEVDKK